jgi:hypothetical protein
MFGRQGLGSPSGGLASNKVPSGYKLGKLQNFSPEQMQLFQSLFSNVSPDSFTSKLAGGDQETFNQIEAPALKQFSGLQGNIASRFSGMGTGGRRSSGFQNTMNQGASDFAEGLSSRRQSLQRQALMDLMGMSESLLSQKPYEQFLVPKKQSFLESLFGNLTSGAGSLGGMFGGSKLGLF